MNLNLLIALDTLLSEKNVTRAAEKLSLSQSAMSTNLKQLRAIFKNDLLIRENNQFSLTKLAQELQPKLHQILESLKSLIDFGDYFNPKQCHRMFKIGMTDQWASCLLPNLMSILSKEAPHIKINIFPLIHVHDDTPFSKHHCDMTFARSSALPKNITQKLLTNEPMTCVIGKKNPLVKKANLTIDDYVNAKHISWRTENAEFPSAMDEYLLSIGKSKRNSVLHIPYIDALYRIIEKSPEYISTISMSAARLLQKKHGCVIRSIPFDNDLINNKFYLSWHNQFDHDLAHQWMRMTLINVIQKSVR